MFQTLTIAKRELTSLFFSPVGYVVLGLFALGSSLIFLGNFASGQPASMAWTYSGIAWLLVFLAPGISMGAFSTELQTGTFEKLMAAPISDTQVVLGKWVGVMGFYGVLLSPLLVDLAVLEIYGDPDYGPVFTGLLGLALLGGLYLALGVFASAMTRSQMIAYFITAFGISILTIAMALLPRWPALPTWAQQAMYYVNVLNQFDEFKTGLIDLRRVFYFGSLIALFLFLTVKLVESRRWR